MNARKADSEYPFFDIGAQGSDLFELDDDQAAAYCDLAAQYRPAVSVYEHPTGDGSPPTLYHLHRECIELHEGKHRVRFCDSCMKYVRKQRHASKPRPPPLSIAAGIDFGKPWALGLPALSIVEQLAIGMVRTDQVCVKLRAPVPGAEMTAIKGHVISFVQDGPEKIAQNVDVKYPLLEEVQRSVSVRFICPKHYADRHTKTIHNLPDLQLRPEVVFPWLHALKALNPMYVHNKNKSRK